VLLSNDFAKQESAKRKTVHLVDGVFGTDVPTKPANFLLFGHDTDGNSDTMMEVHLDGAAKVPLW
jgi:hypothetical protein